MALPDKLRCGALRANRLPAGEDLPRIPATTSRIRPANTPSWPRRQRRWCPPDLSGHHFQPFKRVFHAATTPFLLQILQGPDHSRVRPARGLDCQRCAEPQPQRKPRP